MKTKIGWRIDDDLKREVELFSSKLGIPHSRGAEILIKSGLVVENSDLYDTGIAHMVRSLMRGELSLFRESNEDAVNETMLATIDSFEVILRNQEAMVLALALLLPLDDLSIDERVTYLKSAGSLSLEGFAYNTALDTSIKHLIEERKAHDDSE